MSRRRQRSKAYRMRRALRRKGWYLEINSKASTTGRRSPAMTLYYKDPSTLTVDLDAARRASERMQRDVVEFWQGIYPK